MIKNQNRSQWIGASDTRFVMGNWETATFAKWFCVKLGLLKNNFVNREMIAGTNWEHRIAETIKGEVTLDRQIKIRKYRVRINLDAETKDTIYEIKTRGEAWKKVPKNYLEQVQVQMWGTGKRKAKIRAYTLEEEDYINFFRPLDETRLEDYEIPYDEEFISRYLARVKILSVCMRKGVLPRYGN